MTVGTKVWFEEEVQGYTVKACDDRFWICTKPFNARKTYLYSIVDLKRNVRGRDNLVFGFFEGYKTTEACQEALKELQTGGMEVSYRHSIPVKVKKVLTPNKE
jgi:hypothetical protein